MKRILVLIAIICFGKIASAQTDTIPPAAVDTSVNNMKEHEGYKNAYITLQGGSVLVVKENKTMKLDKDKTLKNGTVVTTDGTVKLADGTTSKLKEGDRIYFDGRLGTSKDQ